MHPNASKHQMVNMIKYTKHIVQTVTVKSVTLPASKWAIKAKLKRAAWRAWQTHQRDKTRSITSDFDYHYAGPVSIWCYRLYFLYGSQMFDKVGSIYYSHFCSPHADLPVATRLIFTVRVTHWNKSVAATGHVFSRIVLLVNQTTYCDKQWEEALNRRSCRVKTQHKAFYYHICHNYQPQNIHDSPHSSDTVWNVLLDWMLSNGCQVKRCPKLAQKLPPPLFRERDTR